MKTKLFFFIFLFFIFITKANNSKVYNATSAFQDANLVQLIITTYPNIDVNNDNDISISELDGTFSQSSYPNSITLNFDYLTFSASGINFSGMEHFRIATLKIIGNNYQGNILQGYNLDLAKLGGATGTNSFAELYVEGIFFTSLPFATSKSIVKLSFIDCTDNMNLESLNMLPENGLLNYLEIRNSGLFATLDLKSRTGLKTFLFRNTYIENLIVKNCTNLESLFVAGVGELLSITLPGYNKLKTLTVNGMPKLNSIDISKETNLEILNLQTSTGFPNNQIQTIDFTNHINLKTLTIANLDAINGLNFSKNINLTELLVNQMNNTNSLDVTTLINLKKITVSGNNLSTLNITKNVDLEFLDCFSNQLTQIDVSKNISLKELYLNSNKLTKIDTKTNVELLKLELDDNLLTFINITKNSKLEWLRCQRNNLKVANVANGNNANMNVWDFKAVLIDQNPPLSCVLVDDNIINSIPIQWQKDVTSNYTLNDEITITDTNFYTELLNYPEKIDVDENGKIATCEAEIYVSTINVSNKNILSLNGIEAFLNLSGLNCSDNVITELDLSRNPALTQINCANNNLMYLNVANNMNATITSFDAGNNGNLSCIQVDAGFNPPNTWIKDGSANFSFNCATASLANNTLHNTVNVYPNPFKNKINVANFINESLSEIKIFNNLGKLLKKTKKDSFLAKSLTKGIYFMKIEFVSGKTVFRKIIKN